MSSFRLECDYTEIGNQLLKSAWVDSILAEVSGTIAGRCGAGYATDQKSMGTRHIASVYTETDEAKRDNMDNNTLLRAL